MIRYRFSFSPELPAPSIAAALLLATIAVRGLHGEAQTRLDLAQAIEVSGPDVAIEATTVVGRDLAKVFTAFLVRQFGGDAFRIERIHTADIEG